ncbi:MAG: hypothetical protein VB862_01880, partial [Pirellulaceae bacterium]
MDDSRYQDMLDFLKELGTEEIPHTDKPFLAHLISVYKDLQRWGCDLDICRAGMFHSIYGTEKFRHFSIPLDQRSRVQELIGERAERLAFWNCFMDREAWDTIFKEQTGSASWLIGKRVRLTRCLKRTLMTSRRCTFATGSNRC